MAALRQSIDYKIIGRSFFVRHTFFTRKPLNQGGSLSHYFNSFFVKKEDDFTHFFKYSAEARRSVYKISDNQSPIFSRELGVFFNNEPNNKKDLLLCSYALRILVAIEKAETTVRCVEENGFNQSSTRPLVNAVQNIDNNYQLFFKKYGNDPKLQDLRSALRFAYTHLYNLHKRAPDSAFYVIYIRLPWNLDTEINKNSQENANNAPQRSKQCIASTSSPPPSSSPPQQQQPPPPAQHPY